MSDLNPIVEIEDEVGGTVQDNLTPGVDVVVDVDASGAIVDVWEQDLGSIEVILEGPQGPGYEILDEGVEPGPGNEGRVYLIRQS